MLFILSLHYSVRVTSVHTEPEDGLRVHSRDPYFVHHRASSPFMPVDQCGSFAECASRSTLIRRAGLPVMSAPQFLPSRCRAPLCLSLLVSVLTTCGAVGGYANTRRLTRCAGIHSASPSRGGGYGSSGASPALVKNKQNVLASLSRF